jgi:hypothetical protein
MTVHDLVKKYRRKPLWWLKSLIHSMSTQPELNTEEDFRKLEAAEQCLQCRLNEKRHKRETWSPAGLSV